MGAIWEICAAILDPRIQFLIADGGLLSYKTLVQSDRYKQGADIMIPGVLNQFDLPQASAAIADRHLVLISPVGPMKTPVSIDEAKQAYQFTQETYDRLGVRDRFQIAASNPVLGLAAHYHALVGAGD
jgi:hypothetical protein